MLGSVVNSDRPSDSRRNTPRRSTKLRDAILDQWEETRVSNSPTLVPQEEVWQEYWLYASETRRTWCPRYAAIASFARSAPTVNEAEALWNLMQGTVYHELFQQKILSMMSNGLLLGSWVNEKNEWSCGIPPVAKLPPGCVMDRCYGPKPESGKFRYVEPKFRLTEQRVVVKLDGILNLEPGSNHEVLELKTEQESARDSLDTFMGGGPRPHHVEQCQIGMHASGIHRARLVYVFKGATSIQSAMLEHEIQYDPEAVKALLETAEKCVAAVSLCDSIRAENPNNAPLWSTDEEIGAWMNERFPRLPECPMKSKGRAAKCPMRDGCFPGRGKKKC